MNLGRSLIFADRARLCRVLASVCGAILRHCVKKLMQMVKTGIFRPGKTSKCFKIKTETFREGSSDHLLSVDVKILLKL